MKTFAVSVVLLMLVACGRKEPPPGMVRASDLSAVQLLQAGTRSFQGGDADLALKLLDMAVEKDPARGEAYLVRASVKSAKGDGTGARTDLDKAIELSPGMAEAWHNRGTLRARAGELDGALDDYAKAVELNPSLSRAWIGRARVKARQGDAPGVRADLSKALEADPKASAAYEERGKLALAGGLREEALADLRKAVELDPAGQETSRLWLWTLRARAGERKEADAELEAYLSKRQAGKPGDPFSKTAGFLLGRMTEDIYLRGAPTASDPKGRERRCEMLCFAGARKAIDGDKGKASEHFKAALHTEAHDCAAFHVARAEIAALTR